MKLDHHYHGPFDFSREWKLIQGYCFGNILKKIVDTAIQKDINLLGILTEDFGEPQSNGTMIITPTSVRNKFYQLQILALSLPRNYQTEVDGPVLTVEKRGHKPVCIINSQTPLVRERGKRLDHLVLGIDWRRTIPNLLSLEETNKWINENYEPGEVIRVAEHVGLEQHFGLTKERFIEEFHRGNYDALEFNAQMINPENPNSLIYKIPLIGERLKIAHKGLNKTNLELSEQNKIPILYGSDGHRISHLGIAYTEIPEEDIDFSNGRALLKSLKKSIQNQRTTGYEGYATYLQWTRWLGEFIVGHSLREGKLMLPQSGLTAEYKPGIFEE